MTNPIFYKKTSKKVSLNALNSVFKTAFSFCESWKPQNRKRVFFNSTVSQKCFAFDGLFFQPIDLSKSIWIDWNIFSEKTKTFFLVLRFQEIAKKLTDRFAKSKVDRWDKKLTNRFCNFRFNRWVKKLTDRFSENNSYRSVKKVNQFRFVKTVSKVYNSVKNKHRLELNKALFLLFFYRRLDFCIFFTAD